jgi:adenylate cyclase
MRWQDVDNGYVWNSQLALTSVQPPPKKSRWTISLRWLMIFGFGGLVLLSIGGVLFMTVQANFKNTFSLLNQQTLQMISGMERSIEGEMTQVEFALKGLNRLHEEGSFDVDDTSDRQKMLKASLRSVQVIELLEIATRSGGITGYVRTPDGKIKPLRYNNSISWDGILRRSNITQKGQPGWVGGTIRNGRLAHDITLTLYSDGAPAAQVRATVGGHSINRLVSSLANDGITTAFVVNDTGALIAHSSEAGVFRDTPEYKLEDFPIPAMKQFLLTEKLPGFVEQGFKQDRFEVRATRGQDENFFYITTPMPIFSKAPYTLGAYFKAADINTELRRAGASALIGLAALLLTLLAAILFSNHLSKPMRRIALATTRFSRLELDGFEPLPRSRVRELDTQSTGINTMHTALSQFSKYVPQKLVQRIMESGSEVTRPVERPVTVMFTDIVDFTAGSEELDAAAITAMLNEHFELISHQISLSHGTVDKYLGDGVMAFWGAPETDDDHAAHAIQAAIEIKAAFETQCSRRRLEQRPCLQLRLGIHTGRAIVGNIGGDDRTNYTVIGHTVNVANRIEQLGKQLIESRDVIISISNECFEAAGRPDDFIAAGAHVVRGSSKPISLYTHEFARDANIVDILSTASQKSADLAGMTNRPVLLI